MNWKISIFVFALFFACKYQNDNDDLRTVEQIDQTPTTSLIEVEELLALAKDPRIKIIDFRKSDLYKKGHIEGALNLWRTDIEDKSFPYGGMMASKEQLEYMFSQMGIENGDTLILYDNNGLCDASRLWWILQNYDFHDVKMLHGGYDAWIKEKGKISQSVPEVRISDFQLKDNSSMKYYISKEEILSSLDKEVILLDTRTGDEFSGKRQKNGALKAGRIPKSKSIDWSTTINYDTDKRFKSMDDLTIIYNEFDPKNDIIITYCHSGVRSAHTTFVLTQLLGFENVKNYDGSWTEWSYFEDLPVLRDSITTVFN